MYSFFDDDPGDVLELEKVLSQKNGTCVHFATNISRHST